MTEQYELPYNGEPPFVAGSDTSEAAAESVATSVTALRRKILGHIREVKLATCDEVEVALHMSHQTASARIRELCLMGKLKDTGERRPTRSGRSARIYQATV